MAEKSGLPPPTAPQVDQAAMQQAQPPQQPPQAGGYPELPPSYEEAQGGPKQQQPPYPTQQPGMTFFHSIAMYVPTIGGGVFIA